MIRERKSKEGMLEGTHRENIEEARCLILLSFHGDTCIQSLLLLLACCDIV